MEGRFFDYKESYKGQVRLQMPVSDYDAVRLLTSPAQWARFIRKYRAEMAIPQNSHAIELLAALSRQCNFSIGCYCEDEAHCHRSILRELLADKGAKLEP